LSNLETPEQRNDERETGDSSFHYDLLLLTTKTEARDKSCRS
jgi:hypothetical protein